MKFSKKSTYYIDLDEKAADSIIGICSHFLITNTATGEGPEFDKIIADNLRDELSVLLGRPVPESIEAMKERLGT